jgi:hypothetical protein
MQFLFLAHVIDGALDDRIVPLLKNEAWRA